MSQQDNDATNSAATQQQEPNLQNPLPPLVGYQRRTSTGRMLHQLADLPPLRDDHDRIITNDDGSPLTLESYTVKRIERNFAHLSLLGGSSDPKLKEPETFDGCRKGSKTRVRNFLSQCEIHFRLRTKAFSSEESKVLFACAHLRGDAYQWAETYITAPESSRAKPEFAWFQTWASFKQRLEDVFGDPDYNATCARKLTSLRQTSGVPVYTAEFRRLALPLNWDDPSLKHHYYEGLQDSVKDALVFSNEAKDFEELVSFAERIGNRQHVRGQGTRAASNPGSGSSHRSSMPHTSAPPRRAPIHTPSNAFNPIPEAPAAPASDYDDGGVRPMEVDASRRKTKTTLRRGPVTAAERAYRLKRNLCGYCGGANHYSDSCPNMSEAAKQRNREYRAKNVRASATFSISSPNNTPIDPKKAKNWNAQSQQ